VSRLDGYRYRSIHSIGTLSQGGKKRARNSPSYAPTQWSSKSNRRSHAGYYIISQWFAAQAARDASIGINYHRKVALHLPPRCYLELIGCLDHGFVARILRSSSGELHVVISKSPFRRADSEIGNANGGKVIFPLRKWSHPVKSCLNEKIAGVELIGRAHDLQKYADTLRL
jgi:hypothetical protein